MMIEERDLVDLTLTLEHTYRALGRQPINTYLDPSGQSAWRVEYARLRLYLRMEHAAAKDAIVRAIVAHEPAPPPDTVPPPDVPEPPPEPPQGPNPEWPKGYVPPSRTEQRRVRGGFSLTPKYPLAFMAPGWAQSDRLDFYAKYRAAWATDHLEWLHLPIGIWGSYPTQPTYDYRESPIAFRVLLVEMMQHRICPIVKLHTDAIPGMEPYGYLELLRFLSEFVPHISDLPGVVYSMGWEFNQIDREWRHAWCHDGRQQALFARFLRTLLPTSLIYGHWSDERWAGRPTRFPDGSYEDYDEFRWWAETPLDGLLYQDDNHDADAVVKRALHIPSPHGYGPGILGRMHGMGREFVMFEFGDQDSGRAHYIRTRLIEDGRADGWC